MKIDIAAKNMQFVISFIIILITSTSMSCTTTGTGNSNEGHVLDEMLWINRSFVRFYGLTKADIIPDRKAYPENLLAGGRTFDAYITLITKIAAKPPTEFGNTISSSIVLEQSDHNKADFMTVIEYDHGYLQVHMARGGHLRSSLPGFHWINDIKVGNEIKVIPMFIEWHSKDSSLLTPTEYRLN